MFDARAPAAGAVTIDLTKPVTGHQGTINQITLREPTFGDWVECGDIQKASLLDNGNEVRLDVDAQAFARWFQRLSGLPMGVLTQIAYSDSRRVFSMLTKMVGGTEGNAKVEPTNSSSSAGSVQKSWNG